VKKIISLFKRNYDGDRLVYNEVVPGTEWVINGEGLATYKWDGTACMIRDGILYKRYDVRMGKQPPEDFEPAQERDEVTGHWPGWVKVKNIPDDKWHLEAWEKTCGLEDGTYELCGPKVQGNPHGLLTHMLIKHGAPRSIARDFPRDFDSIRNYFEGVKDGKGDHYMEGVVWHHPDGRMVKIKVKDFFKKI
jgi:hypothetical protein